MNTIGGRRGVQVAVLTGALLVVLAFLAIDTLGKSQDTRAVWVLTRSAAAGAVLDSASVRMERIPAPRDSYSFVSSSPVGKFAAHAMSPGDILRPDDIETSPQVAVPIKLGGYQGAPGDTIDIYAIEGGKATLVGRGITVLAGSTVQVPASDEPLWIALYGSSATLVGARSNGTGVPDGSGVSGADAARRLSVLARGAAASPAP
ncbi:MAG: hypothetical protein QOK05_2852 [Chloroflexota bacterium]|jgi:hypothetical protein|nr:hypothetical protein [Chloroflexota bacterium]